MPRRLIAEAIDIVVFIAGRGTARRVGAVMAVEGLDAAGEYILGPLVAGPGSKEIDA